MQDCFEGVLGADLMAEHAKPDVQAFQKVAACMGNISFVIFMCECHK